MRKNILNSFKCLIAILIVSCSTDVVKEENIDLGINFNTSSTIIIHYQNAPDSTYLETSFYNFFPSDVIENKIRLSNDRGKKVVTFNIQHPQKVDLSFGNTNTTCFLVPNDTMEIHLNLDTAQNVKKHIEYVGRFSALSDYYKTKELYFGKSDFNYSKAIAFNTAKTLSDYLATMDTLTHNELDYIMNYRDKHLLPNWFIDYEIANIKSSTADSKISIVWFRKLMLGINDSIPKDYYSDIQKFMADCPNSNLSIGYIDYWRNYFQYQQTQVADSLNMKNAIESNNFLVNSAIKYLPQTTADIFLTRNLDMIIELNRLNDETYSLYNGTIENEQFKKYLNNRKENGMILKPNDNAPPFMLPNINKEQISLDDFKGNFIYLSFWYSGCRPCLREFPDENVLVQKFKNNNVKFINICTNTSKKTWKYLLKKYGLKTINLFADSTLDKFIEKNYDITSYPHHVLIDPNGKIIKNKCSRPKDVEVEILKLLD